MKDEIINDLIKKEIARQKEGLNLIASENYASPGVLKVLGTPLGNKYSEGYPGKRYYGGNEFIDKIENLAIERAKKIFNAEYANVQPHSGSQANAAVYLALLKPGARALGFNLRAGGHLTHGFPVNFSGQIYKFSHYGVDNKTELIDFKDIEEKAKKFRPKLIIASTSSYSRILDFKKFKKIANQVGAYLMADIAHIAGLIVAGLHPHPFPYCDVVTTTTHKTLRGPRGGLILAKKYLAAKINQAVFPGIQGGPFEHSIAAKAICFQEAMSPSFKKYQRQVILNAAAMADEFQKQGIRVVSGGTDNHLMVLDVSSFGMDSKTLQEKLETAGIYVNRNTIPFDKNSSFNPSGIRIGVPAVTSRGFKEDDLRKVSRLIVNLIRDIGNKENIKRTKAKVKKMVKRFPVYENIKW